MVTTFYPPANFGGDGQAVRRLTHALAGRGHEVDVIHNSDAYLALGGVEAELPVEPPGVRVHRLHSRYPILSSLAIHQLGQPVLHGRAIRDILAGGFDVIHFHNASMVGGPGVFGYGRGIKLYTAHEHWLVCPTHTLWRHNRELCTGRQCNRCALHYRRPPQTWRWGGHLTRSIAHIDEFLTLSHAAASNHARFDFPRTLRVVPAFLPDAESDVEPVQVAATRPYFLFVGRLSRIKGLHDVIPHFTGDGESELWVAGTGEEAEALRRLAAGSARVRFLGHQDPAQLRGLYRNAHAVVLPSVCHEVFPMVVLEAFREGTPIIARDLGPFPEIVAGSDGGLLFRSPEELGAAIQSLTVDPTLRARLGAAGRHAFETKWSESVAIGAYLDVIHEVAERRGISLDDPPAALAPARAT